ncbi:AraC family transcriptional regulator [Streptomyces sp. NPDC057430]|uniref:AraC family transcriptional regulator n=1 Tax=Streptomyces sp. NPDC057430 TaxID=3346131 RepID=UPI0036A08F3F
MDVVSDAVAAVRMGQAVSERVRVSGSWCARFAPYDGAGFHVVLEGGCWLLPDGGTPVSLGVGDAVLLPHGTGHVIADSPADAATLARAMPFERWTGGPPGPRRLPRSMTGGVELLCGKYRLDHSRVHPLLAELPTVVHLPNRVGDHPELRAAIGLLGGELTAGRPGTGIAVPSLVDLLLVYMIRGWVDQGGGAWSAALGDPVTAAALRALHADPAAAWTNERLAAEAGVSRPTLARRFTSLVGRPPMAYLTWWRLTLAAGALRDTRDSLAAIARRVGYGTPYALSHAFSREFGTTPGRYRARAVGVDGRRGKAGGAGTPREGGEAEGGAGPLRGKGVVR